MKKITGIDVETGIIQRFCRDEGFQELGVPFLGSPYYGLYYLGFILGRCFFWNLQSGQVRLDTWTLRREEQNPKP